MREIKFRAWDPRFKFMFKVGQITLKKGTWNYEPEYENREYKGISVSARPDVILMQFTGLKDKNGVEIYEGDSVKYKFGTYGKEIKATVKFDLFKHSHCDEYECEHYGWHLEYEWDNYRHNTGIDLYTIHELCEVIGNIYEGEKQ